MKEEYSEAGDSGQLVLSWFRCAQTSRDAPTVWVFGSSLENVRRFR